MNRKTHLYLLLALMPLFLLNSCKVFYPNQMFRQKDYQFFEFAQKKINEYTIEPGDELSVKVYSRDGFKLIDVFSRNESGNNNIEATGGNNSDQEVFYVDHQGFIKLPVVGELYVKGYSHKELELMLANKYSTLFVDPFVKINVNNRRVFVFNSSVSTVVKLNETPTSLIEVLAKSGGVDQNTKAYKIKIIRGDLANPTVQLIDLSTLEGLRNADLAMLPNDIVYIERRRRLFREVMIEISPIVSALSMITSTIVLIRTLGK